MTREEVANFRQFMLSFPYNKAVRELLKKTSKTLPEVFPSEKELYLEFKGIERQDKDGPAIAMKVTMLLVKNCLMATGVSEREARMTAAKVLLEGA